MPILLSTALGILLAAAIISFIVLLRDMYSETSSTVRRVERLETKYWELRNQISDLENK
jgi:hypothetical protein